MRGQASSNGGLLSPRRVAYCGLVHSGNEPVSGGNAVTAKHVGFSYIALMGQHGVNMGSNSTWGQPGVKLAIWDSALRIRVCQCVEQAAT